MIVLALAAVAVPLAGAGAALVSPSADRALCRALWMAPLPALALAVVGVPFDVAVPWLGLSTELALDSVGRAWLALAGGLWAVAGLTVPALVVDAAERQVRFASPFLATLSGTVIASLAADAVTFFAGFALVTYAAYPLVVHDGSPRSRRAGRVYLQFAVAGEAVLLAGLVTAVAGVGTLELGQLAAGLGDAPGGTAAVALLALGCGVKAGMLGVHMWLPLAHPAAPVPASAVLSGVIIKVGLLGWVRLLPADQAGLAGFGLLAVGIGVAGAFAGALLGLTQRDPKSLLAYSSVSQMGLMLTLVGGVVAGAAPAGLAAVALFAVHHGAAKATLFLGVGVGHTVPGRRRAVVLAGQAFAALTLAGAPLTSGMAAKAAVKDVGSQLWSPWGPTLDVLLPLTGAATTMLLGRLLWLQAAEGHTDPVPRGDPARRMLAGWGSALGLTAGGAWLVAVHVLPGLSLPAVTAAGVWWDHGWPIALGLVLLVVVTRGVGLPTVPPGDVLTPIGNVIISGRRQARALTVALGVGAAGVMVRLRSVVEAVGRIGADVQSATERMLSRGGVVGTAALVLLVGLSAALLAG